MRRHNLLWHPKEKSEDTMAILTLSRQFGSGGKEVGEAVAAALGYDYLDKEKILLHVKEAGGKVQVGDDALDERCSTLWERYDRSFKAFAAFVQMAILDCAAKDRVVVMGRGGNLLLKGVPHAFRVRIVAPLESRIARISKRESVDRETAVWLGEKTDRERECFVFSIYGTKLDAPGDYDAVIDTSERPLDEIVSQLIEALAERDHLATPDARRVVEMRAVAAKLKAWLYSNPSFFLPTLDVESDGSSIILTGIVHNPREHRKVEEEAKRLVGEYPLKCSLHYRL